jgi:hypothetical protein
MIWEWLMFGPPMLCNGGGVHQRHCLTADTMYVKCLVTEKSRSLRIISHCDVPKIGLVQQLSSKKHGYGCLTTGPKITTPSSPQSDGPSLQVPNGEQHPPLAQTPSPREPWPQVLEVAVENVGARVGGGTVAATGTPVGTRTGAGVVGGKTAVAVGTGVVVVAVVDVVVVVVVGGLEEIISGWFTVGAKGIDDGEEDETAVTATKVTAATSRANTTMAKNTVHYCFLDKQQQ